MSVESRRLALIGLWSKLVNHGIQSKSQPWKQAGSFPSIELRAVSVFAGVATSSWGSQKVSFDGRRRFCTWDSLGPARLSLQLYKAPGSDTEAEHVISHVQLHVVESHSDPYFTSGGFCKNKTKKLLAAN